jgi:hypothetical protein
MRLPEHRLDVERERQLDGLACRARGGDDDDAPAGPAANEIITIAREERIVDRAQGLAYCGFSGLRTGGFAVESALPSRASLRRGDVSALGLNARAAGEPPRRVNDPISRGSVRRLGPKTTAELAGRFLMALAQSVGAGCWDAGTPVSQTRQSPAGGVKVSGIRDGTARASCAASGLAAAASANNATSQAKRVRTASRYLGDGPPYGRSSGANGFRWSQNDTRGTRRGSNGRKLQEKL